jgi:Pentapeptide repeats (9 copies)
VQFSRDLLQRVLAADLLPQIPMARFDRASFDDGTDFDGITFDTDIHLREARFVGNTSFAGAVFKRSLDMGNAMFGGDLNLSRARFESTSHLGPCIVRGHLVLDFAVFERAVVIDVAAFVAKCNSTVFTEGVTLLLGAPTHLIRERSTLGRSSLVAESSNFILQDTSEVGEEWFDNSPNLPANVVFGTLSRDSF